MTQVTDTPSGAMHRNDAFLDALDSTIAGTNAMQNDFYAFFREGGLSPAELKVFADQYCYYIRPFPKMLAALAFRVDDEWLRAGLAKTLEAELRDGSPDQIHFRVFERAAAALGVEVDPVGKVVPIPEAEALVSGIFHLFLDDSEAAALGGHYAIERTDLQMIANLYEGFRLYRDSTIESLEYFYIHLQVEREHIAWTRAAVAPHLATIEGRADVERGALLVARLLSDYWDGLYREVRQLQQPRATASAL